MSENPVAPVLAIVIVVGFVLLRRSLVSGAIALEGPFL